MKKEVDVFKQTYMSAEDLKVIIPTMGIKARSKFIQDIRKQMEEENYYIPAGRTKLALTKLIKERLLNEKTN